jgi:hypothetical protein
LARGALRIVEVGKQARAGQCDLHRRLDRCILHPLEFAPTDLTALQAFLRLEKLARLRRLPTPLVRP